MLGAMNERAMLEPPRSVRWENATFVAEMNAQDIALPKPNLVQALCIWFRSVSVYHQAEMEQISRGEPTEEDRREQRHTLSVLINVGEWLVRDLHQRDVTANAGVTLADVEATLEELYLNQRVTFGGMTDARRAQVLDEVFGAA